MPPKKLFPGSNIILSLGLIVASVIYAAWQNITSQQTKTSPAQEFKIANDSFLRTLAEISAKKTSPVTTTLPSPQTTPEPSTQPTLILQKPSSAYLDGSYLGKSIDAYYGIVQVRVAIQNGKLANVQFLQYPSDRTTSRYINGEAMPLLISEAIQAQDAQVNGVSGATFTSEAFQQSLASALIQAKN